jgi:hypothetical protein
MKATKKFDRKRLREIVESYDGNMRMFETLRSNSYEPALAAHSLEDLDLFYSQIFAPEVSLEDTAQSCPPWPEGTRLAGERPKVKLLENIHNRFMALRKGDLLVKKKRLKLEERKVKMLEKKSQAEVKGQTSGGPITKEGWEQIERDLKLI